MPELLTTGCPLSCSFGLTPSVFVATEMPGKPVVNEAFAAATIVEIVPIANVPPFGMCSSEMNPEVIAATAAALGALTPMPCVPVIVDPWAPPSILLTADGLPLATVESRCLCAWGGMISAVAPAESNAATDA